MAAAVAAHVLHKHGASAHAPCMQPAVCCSTALQGPQYRCRLDIWCFCVLLCRRAPTKYIPQLLADVTLHRSCCHQDAQTALGWAVLLWPCMCCSKARALRRQASLLSQAPMCVMSIHTYFTPRDGDSNNQPTAVLQKAELHLCFASVFCWGEGGACELLRPAVFPQLARLPASIYNLQ